MSSHCSPRIAIANCEQWYIIFCIFSIFLNKLELELAYCTTAKYSYLKDTTAFINFIEKTKIPEKAILVSMDVTSLYTNIPQEEGIETICRSDTSFYQNRPPFYKLIKAKTRARESHRPVIPVSNNIYIFCNDSSKANIAKTERLCSRTFKALCLRSMVPCEDVLSRDH